MIRYHSSATRNTERFVQKLNLPCSALPEPPTGKFIIFTPTVGDGDCPEAVLDYLSEHHLLCVGAIIGGNRNFGASFGGAGRVIHDKFGIRTLYKFELAGTEVDVEKCRKGIIECLNRE